MKVPAVGCALQSCDHRPYLIFTATQAPERGMQWSANWLLPLRVAAPGCSQVLRLSRLSASSHRSSCVSAKVERS